MYCHIKRLVLSLNVIKWLVFVMETRLVFCDVGTICLYIYIYIYIYIYKAKFIARFYSLQCVCVCVCVCGLFVCLFVCLFEMKNEHTRHKFLLISRKKST
jgi:hypothetical protein